ncbi:MAG TPA: Gfo/Idh/MocA family oxidoreductase [Firmicutes bacterium]|nr:Gfo/Idh/MocA family oxidoreductase [Bacillota bacterium]
MSKIRIGFIGSGNIAGAHAIRMAKIPEIEIAALCDIDPDAFARLHQRAPNTAGPPTFADYRDMLDSVELDAVAVLTPHVLHYEHIMTSLDRGLHVLTEKPMVCTTKHAQEIIERQAQTGKVVLVSYQRRYHRTYRFIRDLVQNNMLGQIQYISALQSQNWLRDQEGKWRQDPALSGGGQLNDSGSHLLDILLWMTDLTPATVYATCENFGKQVDINTGLTVRCTNGTIMNLAVVGHGTEFYEDVTIWGEKGVAYYRNGTVRVRLRGESEDRGIPEDIEDSNPDRNFVDAVLGTDTVHSTPADALKVISLTECAWRSAELGQPVSTGLA